MTHKVKEIVKWIKNTISFNNEHDTIATWASLDTKGPMMQIHNVGDIDIFSIMLRRVSNQRSNNFQVKAYILKAKIKPNFLRDSRLGSKMT